MKYHKSTVKEATTFEKIPCGELFEYRGNIYLKTFILNLTENSDLRPFPGIPYNFIQAMGVSLEVGKAIAFLPDQPVKLVSYKPLEIE